MVNEEDQNESVQTSPIGEEPSSNINIQEAEEEPVEKVKPKKSPENENGISWKEIETKKPQINSIKAKSQLHEAGQEAPQKPFLSGRGYANLGILFAFLCFLPGLDLIPLVLGPLGAICGMIAYLKGEQARAILAIVLSIIFSIISIFFLDAILAVI